MKLTRFELSFEGEAQEVGFIIGLKDAGINEKTIQSLVSVFDKALEVPHPECRTKSYFTEAGAEKFATGIEKIIKAVNQKKNGWAVNKIILEAEPTALHIVHMDCYQVLIKT